MGRWLRRLMPGMLRALAALSCMGPGMLPPPFPSWEEDGMDLGPGGGPPPGHPERLAGRRPLTLAERELWTSLDEIDWW